MAEGKTVCVVAKSMIETRLVPEDPANTDGRRIPRDETVGLTFRLTPIIFGDGGAYDNGCSEVVGFDMSVVLRKWLGLIREA